MSNNPQSLWLLVDGYNVVAPIAAPAIGSKDDWLHQQRMLLIRRLSDHLPARVCARTCVVFDAANPPRDRDSRFVINDVEVRFAIGYPEADDLIEELIDAQSAPKRLMVVSSDHRVQAAARRRGCASCDSDQWLDRLLDGRPWLAEGVIVEESGPQGREGESEKPQAVDGDDVQDWMSEFGF